MLPHLAPTPSIIHLAPIPIDHGSCTDPVAHAFRTDPILHQLSLMLFASKLSMPPLTHVELFSAVEKLENHCGDLWECVAGKSFIDRPGCGLDEEWWHNSWKLDSRKDNTTVRLLLLTAYTQRLQASRLRIRKLSDIDTLYKDLDGFIAELQKRAEDMQGEKRKRSVEGQCRAERRSELRMEAYLARKGKGKGKGSKGEGKGSSANSTPPSSGGKSKGKWK